MPSSALSSYVDTRKCGEAGMVKSQIDNLGSVALPIGQPERTWLCFACRIWGLFGSFCYSLAVCSKSLLVTARHQTIGTVYRAM